VDNYPVLICLLQHAQIRGLPGYPQLEVGEWVDEDNFVVRFIQYFSTLFVAQT
jgi:hypothetical protein